MFFEDGGRASGPVCFGATMRLHPATLLAVWIACACALPWLGTGGLVLASALVLPSLIDTATRARAQSLLRRTRVLLLALLVVYSFATPGTPLLPDWGGASPTVEGVIQGGLQAWRLALLLASLAWLLSALGRIGLLAAVYTVLRPLGVFGLPVERFAVRLSLVLGMAESAPRVKLSAAGLAAAMDAPPLDLPDTVTVDIPAASWRDALCLALLALGLGWLLW